MTLRLSIFATVLALLAGLLIAPVSMLNAGADTVPLSPHSDRRVATGWIPWWDLEEGLTSVEAHPKVFSEASLFWYRATPAGHVVAMSSEQPAESELVAAIQRLHAVGVRALPTVTDPDMNSESMGRLLSDPARRKNLINRLVDMVVRVGADGVDIDFEAMNSPASPWRTTVKRKFPLFVDGLRQSLHQQGLRLSLTVPARVSDKDPNWSVYKYRALAKLPDQVQIMTYDYHYAGGTPGPLAPVAWVNAVAHYAHARFGRTPVSLGLPTLGLNWYVKRESGSCPVMDPPITNTAAPTAAQARQLAADWGAKILWDRQSDEHHFRYHRTYSEGGKTCVVLREVWFEGAASVKAKLDVVRKQHVQGLALWTLGIEDPATWPAITTFAKQQAPAVAKSSITAPDSVSAGDPFNIAGRFLGDGHPIIAQQVTVQFRAPGRSWKSRATLPTSSTGRVSYTATTSRTGDWRLELAGGWDWRTTHTSSARVAVHIA